MVDTKVCVTPGQIYWRRAAISTGIHRYPRYVERSSVCGRCKSVHGAERTLWYTLVCAPNNRRMSPEVEGTAIKEGKRREFPLARDCPGHGGAGGARVAHARTRRARKRADLKRE
ncbi:PREDICTED: uncharacterized protein LOC105567142 [Vollenhovia emeryi]|uniref:uncharacterized protein LOC105567142 n=1 Tax=Vollenhovia emeryi TaxID=411798 RepID=UPI0005F55901|nr:PREDICTED: uncharacterized protein LOC105567142 [Vollenhovia emeryi]